MKIEHIAIWTSDLERLKDFYTQYFQASAGQKYHNPKTGFQSYFLTFASGARLEIMQLPGLSAGADSTGQPRTGYAHLCLSVGLKEMVDELTSRLRQDGYRVLDGPRLTGDGYYESQVEDPDGNRLEIAL